MTQRNQQQTSQSVWRRYRGALALLVLLGAVLVAALTLTHGAPASRQASCTTGGAATGLAAGECAPNFTLDDVDGHQVQLADFRGRPVLVHFWAVACPSCAAEYPDFSRVVRAYTPKGLTVLAVDAWGETASLVQSWQQRHHLPATLLIDPTAAIFRLYNGQGTPTTYVIDRSGHIVTSAVGPLSYSAYRAALQTAI